MQKLKILFAATAAIFGLSIAYHEKLIASSPKALHHWRTRLSLTTVFLGTTTQASAFCPGDINVCLIAKDNAAIQAKGTLPTR
jgi:hypothetical protein